MRRILLLTAAALTATAQTQVDLRTQVKQIDFTGAAYTKPFRMGTALPAGCGIGELFFKTSAPAGNNVYACTSPDQWSPQSGAPSLNVESDSTPVGASSTANFVSGPGLMSVISDDGSRITIQSALDTAVAQTQPGEQTGGALLCASYGFSGGHYQCLMTPTLASFTRGMVLHWIPDADSPGGATTLNVDTLGALPLKAADGSSNPAAGDIVAGRMYTIWHDGTCFRLAPATAAASTGGGGIADPGVNGIVYRNGAGSSAAATANDITGPLICADTGAVNAYACNLSPAIPSYTAGATYWFKAGAANTGPATLALNSLAPKPIRKNADRDLEPNDIKAGQWVMVTYDGANMQMQSQAGNIPVGGVSTVFGRSGIVTAQSGDYTTAQVSESANLYFTAARAIAAVTWGTMTGIPSSFPPSGHAASHQSGGSDEIASATPAANAIPKAGSNGKLAQGWIDFTGYQPSTGTFAGNAATATALQATPTKCSAGSYPLGIDAAGNAQNCNPLPDASSITAGAEISITGFAVARNPFDFTQLMGKDDFCGYMPSNPTNSNAINSRLSWNALSTSGTFGSAAGTPATASCGFAMPSQAAQAVSLVGPAVRINAATQSNWKVYAIASVSSIATTTFEFGVGTTNCNNCVVVYGAPGTANLLLHSCTGYTCSNVDTGVPYAAGATYKMSLRGGATPGTIYASVNGSSEVSIASNVSNSFQSVLFAATPTSGTTTLTVLGFAYQMAGY